MEELTDNMLWNESFWGWELHHAAVDDIHKQAGAEVNPDIFYMKQTISNACGTIGVLHAIGNNQQRANISMNFHMQANKERQEMFVSNHTACKVKIVILVSWAEIIPKGLNVIANLLRLFCLYLRMNKSAQNLLTRYWIRLSCKFLTLCRARLILSAFFWGYKRHGCCQEGCFLGGSSRGCTRYWGSPSREWSVWNRIEKPVTEANQIARLLMPLIQIQIHWSKSGTVPSLLATKRQDFPKIEPEDFSNAKQSQFPTPGLRILPLSGSCFARKYRANPWWGCDSAFHCTCEF